MLGELLHLVLREEGRGLLPDRVLRLPQTRRVDNERQVASSRLGRDQVGDYAKRRGMSEAETERWLLERWGDRITIDWEEFDRQWGPLFSEKRGAPAIPTRLIAGLHYLKHLYMLSDEEVVRRWVENVDWQHFCGETYFQHRLPIHPTSMTRWRKRIGEEGCEWLLTQTIEAGRYRRISVYRPLVAVGRQEVGFLPGDLAFHGRLTGDETLELSPRELAILAALLLGFVNAVVRPVLVLLTLPVTLVTLGLFLLVVMANSYFWFLGAVVLPRDLDWRVPPILRADTMWAVTRDAIGVQRVVRFELAFDSDS